MQRIQEDLTRTAAKAIGIISSGFAVPLEIAGDIHSQPAREMKFNLKERFAIFVKKEKFHPQWDSTHNL